MSSRSTILFPIIVLSLLALLTLWIDRTVKLPLHKPDGSSRHDPDYYLKNFVTSKTDLNGNLKYVLAAVEMVHYPDDDSTQLIRPRFTQYGVNKPFSQIEGQRGKVLNNGDTVEVMDNVVIVREATKDRGQMVLKTEYLKVFPNDGIAKTDYPVTITQDPKTVVHGTGLIFNKDEKTLTLLKNVNVHYEHPAAEKVAETSSNITHRKTVGVSNTIPKHHNTSTRR